MKNLLLLLLALFIGQLHAQKHSVEPPLQTFEKIKFTNFEPNWVVDVFDSTRIRLDTFNGYNSFRFINHYLGNHINDGKFYRCHHFREYHDLGFIVNCIDTKSGELLWSKLIDTSLVGTQLVPIYQNFDDKGNLVVYGFRRLKKIDPNGNLWINYEPSKIFKLTLDKYNGNIVNFLSPEESINIEFSGIRANRDLDILSFDPNEQIEFVFRKESSNPNRIKTIKGTINSLGHMMFLDSIEFSPPNKRIWRTRYVKKDHKYYCIEQNRQEGTALLLEMDTMFNLTNSYDIFLKDKTDFLVELRDYTDNYLFYVQPYLVNDVWNYRIYIYGYEGQLINFYDLKTNFLSKFSNVHFEYDDKLGKLLIFGEKVDQNLQTKRATGYLHMIIADSTGYETRKIIKIANQGKSFIPYKVIFDGEENIIFDAPIGLVYYDDKSFFPSFKRAQFDWTFALINASRTELGLKTVSTKEVYTQNQYSIYPNPTSGMIYIGNLEELAVIDIYDIMGQKVLSNKKLEGSLDCSQLKSGIYLMQIHTKNQIETHKLLKVE